MINDEEGYRYTYSPWCKLVRVRWGVSPVPVAEYSYTATGRRVTERYDMNQDRQLTSSEPTTVIATDLAGRRVATFLLKGSSGGPFDAKETFFHHPPEISGPGFAGGPIARDRNAALVDPDEWSQPADPDRLERRYYATDWQGRVVALVTAAGEQAESYRYTANGVPIGIPLGDVNGDGKVEVGASEEDWQQAYWWENNFGPYDARLDLNLDGSVNATDIGLVGSQTPGTMPTARASAASVGNRMFASAMVDREAVLGREMDLRSLNRTNEQLCAYFNDANYNCNNIGCVGKHWSLNRAACDVQRGCSAGNMFRIMGVVGARALLAQAPLPGRIWEPCENQSFCYELYNRLSWLSLSEHNRCMGVAMLSVGESLATCMIACLPSLYFSPAAYGICLAGCTGVDTIINIWNWGNCWDHFRAAQLANVNAYCQCLNKRATCPQIWQRSEVIYHPICAGTFIPRHPDTPVWP